MKMIQDSADPEVHRLRSFTAGRLTIGEQAYDRGVIVAGATLLEDRLPAIAAELEAAHVEAILELEPEIVLVGTGQRQVFPGRPFLAGFLSRGVGVEVMDTAAACRTYNVLIAEGRQVVAALLVD